jgi:hypothetical protein
MTNAMRIKRTSFSCRDSRDLLMMSYGSHGGIFFFFSSWGDVGVGLSLMGEMVGVGMLRAGLTLVVPRTVPPRTVPPLFTPATRRPQFLHALPSFLVPGHAHIPKKIKHLYNISIYYINITYIGIQYCWISATLYYAKLLMW